MTRWSILFALGALALITYVDRAAISSAKDHIAQELQLDDQTMGLVFSVFALGYAIAQAPAGWLADRFGPRWLLAGAVAVWSALTAVTGLAGGLVPLLAIRFAFGLAEAAAFPGSARAIYDALPSTDHGRAHGVIFAASRIGAALAFPMMAWLLWSGWRTAFLALALPGFLWAIVWALWYRPKRFSSHRGRHAGAADGHGFDGVWVTAMVQYFAVNFTTFLTLSWMNPYLKRRYDLTDMEAAGWTVIPLLVGALAQSASGWLTDRLFQSQYRRWSRSFPAMCGFAISTVALLGLSSAGTVQSAVVMFAIAAFGAEMTISPSWAFCLDYGKERSGVMTGTMNTAGSIGSFVSANAFPALAGADGVGAAYFGVVAVLNAIAIICWLMMTRAAGRSHDLRATAATNSLTASES